MSTVAKVAAERVAGGRPSRFMSVLAALAVGAGAAVLTYRVLRGGSTREPG